MSSTLDDVLTALIAKKLDIRPDEVTMELLQSVLERRIYPSTRFSLGSEMGGYDASGVKVLSQDELDKMERDVDEALDALSKEVGAR
jgi:hypothetical protein